MPRPSLEDVFNSAPPPVPKSCTPLSARTDVARPSGSAETWGESGSAAERPEQHRKRHMVGASKKGRAACPRCKFMCHQAAW
eukprot:11206469-Lingulodinium_polyedra.AAC.1